MAPLGKGIDALLVLSEAAKGAFPCQLYISYNLTSIRAESIDSFREEKASSRTSEGSIMCFNSTSFRLFHALTFQPSAHQH